MKQLLEFIPLVIFFIFLIMYDIFAGVAALMIASTLSFIIMLVYYRKIEKMALFTYLMVMIFGAITLNTHNPEYIKWKVTIINFVFAAVLLISQVVFHKNLLQKFLAKEIAISNPKVWNNLNLIWITFFLLLGLVNLYITYHMSDKAWGIFKAFVLPGSTLFFTLISGVYIYKQLDKNSLKS